MILLGALLGFGSLAISISDTPWFFVLLLGAAAILLGAFVFIPGLLPQDRGREKSEADLKLYLQAIDSAPPNAAAYSSLGDTYMEMGIFDKAVESYEKAVDLDPGRTVERNKLAHARIEKERSDRRAKFCPHRLQLLDKESGKCSECGRTFTAKELDSFAAARPPRSHIIFSGAVMSVGALLAVLALVMSAHPWLAVLVFLALLGITAIAVKHLARPEAG